MMQRYIHFKAVATFYIYIYIYRLPQWDYLHFEDEGDHTHTTLLTHHKMGACLSGGLFFARPKRPNFVPVNIPSNVNARANRGGDGYGKKERTSRCSSPCIVRNAPTPDSKIGDHGNNDSNIDATHSPLRSPAANKNNDSKDSNTDCIQPISIPIPITQDTIPFIRNTTPRFKMIVSSDEDTDGDEHSNRNRNNGNGCASAGSDSSASTVAQPVDTLALEEVLKEIDNTDTAPRADFGAIAPKMPSVISDPASSRA